jgi:hypothetical protein
MKTDAVFVHFLSKCNKKNCPRAECYKLLVAIANRTDLPESFLASFAMFFRDLVSEDQNESFEEHLKTPGAIGNAQLQRAAMDKLRALLAQP